MGASRASDHSDHEGLYPIRTVASLTGVNPVTLRAWERRYGLIRPRRTPKGHRLYTEADIERIHRVLELLDQGIPIGQTRRLVEASGEPAAPSIRVEGEDAWTGFHRRAADAIDHFDEAALEAAYNDALAIHPVAHVHRGLVLPLSRELHERRSEEPLGVVATRFFNAFMRNKLGAQLHHHGELARGPKLLAAGLPGESGEIELLLFCLSAIGQGYRVALLGANSPLPPLAIAARRAQARAIVLFGEHETDDPLDGGALAQLVTDSPVPVFVGGTVAGHLDERITAAGAAPLPADSGEALSRLYDHLAR